MAPITKMRIHRFGGKEVLQADDIEPSLPDAGQLLVAVAAASVNPVDFKIRSGKYPAVKDDRLPYTLGRDFSGTVEKCGRPGHSVQTRRRGVRDGEHLRRWLLREGGRGRARDRSQAAQAWITYMPRPFLWPATPPGKGCFVMED